MDCYWCDRMGKSLFKYVPHLKSLNFKRKLAQIDNIFTDVFMFIISFLCCHKPVSNHESQQTTHCLALDFKWQGCFFIVSSSAPLLTQIIVIFASFLFHLVLFTSDLPWSSYSHSVLFPLLLLHLEILLFSGSSKL
jgi:hypothetical protein